jgi:hypothetical protein
MPLIDILVLQLGPAIAKAILTGWLKDQPILNAATSSILDIIRNQTSDVLAQGRAKRQFEAISERVAENLQLVINAEGCGIDEGGQTAVALEASRTIDEAGITTAVLVRCEFDPSKVALYLRETNPTATQHFSSAERYLYERILSEAGQYIVDIASQLPRFTERTLTEILRSENRLLEKADLIIQEVRRIRENSVRENADLDTARFEEQYRRHVVRRLDEITLYGVDVSETSRRHRLSMAYVSLNVTRSAADKDASTPTLAQYAEGQDSSIADEVETVSVDEALCRSSRLLIRGVAGSGKTTLLQWIAVRSASQDFGGTLQEWNGTIPFFIRLRHFPDSRLPQPEEFPGLVAGTIMGVMPKGWVHSQLTSGRALILIDGLDEISDQQREDVKQWIKDLVDTFKEARFIVTTRPHAAEDGWMASERFEEAELQPMGLSDLSAFVDHWHAAVSEALEDNDAKEKLGSLKENLKQVLRTDRAIRSLATNPLLCAMLCALYRERNQQLPSDRIELYEACCAALIERRDLERRLKLGNYPVLSYRTKKALLQGLAYWLMLNGWSEVQTERVDEHLGKRLATMRGVPRDASPSGVRRLLVERTGIIRHPIPGYIDFTHRTFQEFLAAQAVVNDNDTGVLIQHAHDTRWREVIVLSAGIGTRRSAEEVISGLLERGDREEDLRHQLHLLALACLETPVELSTSLSKDVESRLSSLVPPSNMRDAKAVASAGDLAVRYLRMYTPAVAKVPIAAACVKALGLIGTESALDALQEFCDKPRRAIADQLLRLWPLFDHEEYTQRVIRRLCEQCEHLRLRDHVYLEDLLRLPRPLLRTLIVEDCLGLMDLDTLRGFEPLTTLELRRNNVVKSLDPLSGFKGLRELQVNDFHSLESVAAVGTLNLLFLEIWGGKIDLSETAQATKLHSLRVLTQRMVDDLSPIAGMKRLMYLSVGICSPTIDTRVLFELPRLKWFQLLGEDKAPLIPLRIPSGWHVNRVQNALRGSRSVPGE